MRKLIFFVTLAAVLFSACVSTDEARARQREQSKPFEYWDE